MPAKMATTATEAMISRRVNPAFNPRRGELGALKKSLAPFRAEQALFFKAEGPQKLRKLSIAFGSGEMVPPEMVPPEVFGGVAAGGAGRLFGGLAVGVPNAVVFVPVVVSAVTCVPPTTLLATFETAASEAVADAAPSPPPAAAAFEPYKSLGMPPQICQ